MYGSLLVRRYCSETLVGLPGRLLAQDHPTPGALLFLGSAVPFPAAAALEVKIRF